MKGLGRDKDFTSTLDFVNVTSSPQFPQANGLPEKAFSSAKKLLEKSKCDRTDLNILINQNISRDTTFGSPAERLTSKQTHATLLISKTLLTPAVTPNDTVKNQLLKKRQDQKSWYDKTNKPLRPLTEGEVVRMQTQRGHDHLPTVKQISKEPRSYIAESDGHDSRINRTHLLTAPPPLPPRGGCPTSK